MKQLEVFTDLDENEPKSATRFILDQARFSPAWRLISWNGYRLSAQGNNLETCHKWGFKGCLNTHAHANGKIYVESFLKECARSSCPVCVESWTNRIANRITRRVEAWANITHQRASHVVISFPGNLDQKEVKKLLKKNQKDSWHQGFC